MIHAAAGARSSAATRRLDRRSSDALRPRPGRPAAADQARHDQQRRVRARPARTRAPARAPTRARGGRTPARSGWASAGARSSSRPAAPPRRCSPSTAPTPRTDAGAATTNCEPDAAFDAQLARSTLDRGDFVFDVQGHFVNPTGAWTRDLPPGAQPLAASPPRAPAARRPPARATSATSTASARTQFVKDVFHDSDTDMMVLSFVPSTRKGEPLTIEEAAATARIVERLEGTHRLLLHGRVNPNQPGDLEAMDDARGALPHRGVEDLHAMGTGRQRLLPRRRAGPRADREGAQARRAQHRDPQGTAVRPALLRALDLRRRRPRREALSGRQLPDLPLGLRHRQAGGSVRSAAQRRHRRAGHEPRARTA